MKPIVVHDSLGPPLTDQDIAAMERELGVSLPSDYVAFLRKHNGGRPKPIMFPIYDEVYNEEPAAGASSYKKGVLSFFVGISKDDYNDLLNFAKLSEDRVPPEVLPIGRDVFGNLICLAVAGPNRGKVYWWFHEEEADEGEPPTYNNIYFVADSFTELLNSLTELPEES